MRAFHFDLCGLVDLQLNDAALDGLEWKQMGKGVSLATLKREERTGLVLYRVEPGAPDDAFASHAHPGGELYLVLRGTIGDESGSFGASSLVWLDPGSKHTPIAEGDTIVLVLWPGGVRLLD